MKAWADSLGGVTYPLLSDFYPHGKVAEKYGVLRSDGTAERALFVIDKRGIIQYVDVHDINDQPDNEVLFKVLDDLEPSLAAAWHARQSRMVSEPIPEADIVVFCTPWCPDCKKLRLYLQDCGEAFAEVDISRNREAAQMVRGWAGGKEITPTVRVRNSEPIVNFDPERLREAIARLHGEK